MRITLKIAALCCVFFFISCLDPGRKETAENPRLEDFKTVKIDEAYQISLPNFMRGTTALNEEASLQYQNALKETYTIIIDEPKEEFVVILKELGEYDDELTDMQNYRAIQLQLLSSTMTINRQSEPKSSTIHGMKSESIEFSAHIKDVDEEIAYHLTFIDSGMKVYMIMSWTLKSREDQYLKTFKMIAESFTPIALIVP